MTPPEPWQYGLTLLLPPILFAATLLIFGLVRIIVGKVR